MSRLLKLAVCCLALVGSKVVLAEEIAVAGGKIEVQFTETPSDVFHARVEQWIGTAAEAVIGYYGRFPVDTVKLKISPVSGHRVSNGETFGWPGARIQISVGTAATVADLQRDWILTHEMLHLAFPSLRRTHHWLEEGLATYVEPIARARAGFLRPEQVWGDLVDGLPQGLPEADDQGLDGTPTWGRTYWGGALFCLRADVEIRRRTQNRFGLEHALRAILSAGGDIRDDWSIDHVIAVAMAPLASRCCANSTIRWATNPSKSTCPLCAGTRRRASRQSDHVRRSRSPRRDPPRHHDRVARKIIS